MKKDKSKLKCFNHNNKRHFANDCLESKKVNVQITHDYLTNVLSIVLLIESSSLWIINLGATNHITNSRDVFVNFCRVLKKSKWINVGNNEKVKFLEICTCKLVLRGGRVFLLYYVLYTPEIRRNLISVLLQIRNGFCLNFHDTSIDLFLETNFYGSRCQDDCFIVLDLESNNNVSFSLMTSFSCTSDNDVNLWYSKFGTYWAINNEQISKIRSFGTL